ncbi:MAG: ribosome maturation factor RimP [Bacteroidota bacterium]
MELREEIQKLAESRLADTSHFVVNVSVSSHKGPAKIVVVVDGDQGITIDDCANLSRQLSKALDDTALVNDNYTLEVTTPGLDQPLTSLRQYKKNIGRGLKVKLQDKTVEGNLAEVSEEKIVLNQEIGSGKKKETKNLEIPFSSIDKAFVLVSFK